MQRISLLREGGPRRLLALGAHCDDIEIGCGGTVLRLARERPDLEVRWVVFCSTPERAREARASAGAFLQGVAKAEVMVCDHRDGYLPHSGAAVKDQFETLKGEHSPDLILTHYRHDLHQDHRLVSELTWNTWRNHLILEYDETASNDFVFSGGGKKVELLASDIDDWKITFVDTGLTANIGMRLKTVQPYLEGEEMFLANYSDGLSDLPLPAIVDHFQRYDAVA